MALASDLGSELKGRIDLIFTSPPFPLNNKKKYGNLQGEAYIEWLASFASRFRCLLKPKGLDRHRVGQCMGAGKAVMSTLALRALLAFQDTGNFVLCQQFVWHNPARLESCAVG